MCSQDNTLLIQQLNNLEQQLKPINKTKMNIENQIQSLKKEMPQIIELLPRLPKLIEAYLKHNSHEAKIEIQNYQQDIRQLKKSNQHIKIIFTIIFILFIIQFLFLI